MEEHSYLLRCLLTRIGSKFLWPMNKHIRDLRLRKDKLEDKRYNFSPQDEIKLKMIINITA